MTPPLPFEEGVLFARLTTLGVGGPARWLARVRDEAALAAVLAWARETGITVFVLGGGSNLVVADAGFEGLVVRYEGDDVALERDGEGARLRAGAGKDWDELVALAVAEGLAGIECLSGIPGLAGAAPMQNVGAYGQEIADTLVELEALDRETGDRRTIPAADCGLAYRRSRFQSEWRDRFVVLGITLRLARRATGTVRYPELARRLGVGDGAAAPLAEIRAAVRELRASKAMLLDGRDDPDQKSVGSFFVNPVVTGEVAEAVRRRAAERSGEAMPSYPAADGRVKLSAAWLIERAGFPRGTRRGRVGLSTRHALAITNRGEATAAEVVAFAAEIRRGVRDAFAVTLRPEPVFLGFGADGETVLEREERR